MYSPQSSYTGSSSSSGSGVSDTDSSDCEGSTISTPSSFTSSSTGSFASSNRSRRPARRRAKNVLNGRSCSAREVYKHMGTVSDFASFLNTHTAGKVILGKQGYYKNYQHVFILSQDITRRQYVTAIPKPDICITGNDEHSRNKRRRATVLRKRARLLVKQLKRHQNCRFTLPNNKSKPAPLSLDQARAEAFRTPEDYYRNKHQMYGQDAIPTEDSFIKSCKNHEDVATRDIWVRGEQHRVLVNPQMKPFVVTEVQQTRRVRCLRREDIYNPEALNAAKNLYQNVKRSDLAPPAPAEQESAWQTWRSQEGNTYSSVREKIAFYEKLQREADRSQRAHKPYY